MTRFAAILALVAPLSLAACSSNQQGAAPVIPDAPASTAPSALAAGSAAVVASVPSSAPAPSVTAAPVTAPPASTASAAPSAEASAAPAGTGAPAAEGPLPAVKVSNIGMHIGGGPNDDVTKDPIRRSVQPHFDAFRRCFARVDEAKTGDFGVDLRIDRAGGKAQVSHPRTALKGKQFKECVVHTFEEIDFLKPKGGTTTVSYSLRFTPAGA